MNDAVMESELKRDDRASIAVNGATGYVGVHVVHELCRRKQRVTAIVRPHADPRDVEVLRSAGATIAEADSTDESSVAAAMRDCRQLVHLIGSIAPARGIRFSELHPGIAARYFAAAEQAGVQQLVVVTALGAARDAASMYHRTKWQMEQAARDAKLPHLIVRPSLIVGRQVGHRDSKIVRRYLNLIQTRRKVPLVRGGDNLVQPVSVADLARAIAEALAGSNWDGSVCEIGGGEVLTTREFVQRLMKVIGVRKPIASLPAPLAFAVASILELVQDVPLLSRDQVRIAGVNGNCSVNALTEQFGITPEPLDDVLKVYRQEHA